VSLIGSALRTGTKNQTWFIAKRGYLLYEASSIGDDVVRITDEMPFIESGDENYLCKKDSPAHPQIKGNDCGSVPMINGQSPIVNNRFKDHRDGN
jgi:hypothetical protein